MPPNLVGEIQSGPSILSSGNSGTSESGHWTSEPESGHSMYLKPEFKGQIKRFWPLHDPQKQDIRIRTYGKQIQIQDPRIIIKSIDHIPIFGPRSKFRSMDQCQNNKVKVWFWTTEQVCELQNLRQLCSDIAMNMNKHNIFL